MSGKPNQTEDPNKTPTEIKDPGVQYIETQETGT